MHQRIIERLCQNFFSGKQRIGSNLTLVYCCIAPHGGEIIPELAKDRKTADLFSETRKGIQKLATQMKESKPDTIVIASPHNLRLWKKIAIVISENSSGFLISDAKSKERIELSTRCDTRFARELYSRAVKNRLPVVGANYGTFEGSTSDLPMDWGTFIPLWFFLDGEKHHGKKIKEPKVVIVAPSREIPISQNVSFGRLIAKLAQSEKSKRIAFVASADQAHTHTKQSPYGIHPSAKDFDKLAVDGIRDGKIESLLRLDPRFIENSKPDSIWQLAMLQGVVSEVPMKTKLISYQVPTYFGMICAALTPLGGKN
jgi:aromatic ring-opening dioxygenase LigB subunit